MCRRDIDGFRVVIVPVREIEIVGKTEPALGLRIGDEEIRQVNDGVSKAPLNEIVRTRDIYVSECCKRQLCFNDEGMPAKLSKIRKSRKLLEYIRMRVR